MTRYAGQDGVATIGLSLGPERLLPFPGTPGLYMRLDDDLRKTVVFFGFDDNTPGKGGIRCVGTGFLVGHDTCGYLVTAKHLAQGLGENPFLVRVNKKGGGSINLPANSGEPNIRWYEHPDPNVDVAVMPVTLAEGSEFDALYLDTETAFANDYLMKAGDLGVGDLTYTVGLFRLMSGTRRNLPIVHSGIIAMMPGDERIPVKDWRPPNATIFVEGYLVETGALEGLSGSPVFVRPTKEFSTLPAGFIPDPRFADPRRANALAPSFAIGLLGLWQGSWDAPPDDVLAAQAGRGVRVPVGMGIVVPAQKIIETLDLEELREMRQRVKTERDRLAAGTAASLDSAIPLATTAVSRAEPPETATNPEENPAHREDFTALIGVASKPKPKGDRT